MTDTIIAAGYVREDMRPLVLEDTAIAPLAESIPPSNLFKIRAANSDGRRSSASILVNRMYAWRGYKSKILSRPPVLDPHRRVTLVAQEQDDTIGTLSIGFDGPDRLFVDQLFSAEVEPLRENGWKVCEFTKLAVDGVVKSKRVLASLFHVAYIYAHLLKKCDRLLIEVNPRHVRYYERMLGFTQLGPQRLNPRVNALAVLMCLDFAHARREIAAFGGRPERAKLERSLYPFFFSPAEESGIVARLEGTLPLDDGPDPGRTRALWPVRAMFSRRTSSRSPSPRRASSKDN